MADKIDGVQRDSRGCPEDDEEEDERPGAEEADEPAPSGLLPGVRIHGDGLLPDQSICFLNTVGMS
jgi:hypothetical protein